jgi:hypothetical protein
MDTNRQQPLTDTSQALDQTNDPVGNEAILEPLLEATLIEEGTPSSADIIPAILDLTLELCHNLGLLLVPYPALPSLPIQNLPDTPPSSDDEDDAEGGEDGSDFPSSDSFGSDYQPPVGSSNKRNRNESNSNNRQLRSDKRSKQSRSNSVSPPVFDHWLSNYSVLQLTCSKC